MRMRNLRRITTLFFSGLLCITNITINATASDNKNTDTLVNEPILNYRDIDRETGSIHKGAVNADKYTADGVADETFPSSYIPDMEELPDVRNQNPYGTCWAYSSIALAELSILKQEGKMVDLSELHLAYYLYNFVTDPLGGTEGDSVTYGKDTDKESVFDIGGSINHSAEVLASWMGAASEDKYPYDMAEDVISNGMDGCHAYDDVAHLRNAYFIDTENDTDEIKKIIMENGAVGISYNQNYDYYDSIHNSYYNNYNTITNHAVTIVGWNDDFPKENFLTEAPGNGAWLIRNSWGVNDYDMSGYFWLSYYDTSISDTAYAFDFVSSDSEEYYDNNYHYDGGVKTGFSTYGGTSGSVANIFTTVNDYEILKAVSFETGNTNLDYTINIYKNIMDAANPESGSLVSTVSGTTTFEGIYTVKLETPVELSRGDTYSVVINLLCQEGDSLWYMYDYSTEYGWIISNCNAEKGQSFAKNNFSEWIDFGEIKGNLRIKAFTDNATVIDEPTDEEVLFTDIEIEKKVVELKQGETYKVNYRITPDNATEKPEWTSTNTNVAKVSEVGIITAEGCGTAIIECKGKNVSQIINVTVAPNILGVKGKRNTDNTYTLSWNKVIGYDILKITGTDFDGTTIDVYYSDIDEDMSTYTIDNTGSCSTYSVYIEKKDIGYSEDSITVEPGRSGLTKLEVVDGGILVGFSEAQSAKKYIIERRIPTTHIWTEIAVINKDEDYFYKDVTVTAGTEYFYRVYTVNDRICNICDIIGEPVRYYVPGWFYDAGKWFYVGLEGEYVTGWVQDNGKWYYMNESGVMVTGWMQDNGKWYYMNGSGAMVTGWVLNNGKWYYMNESGAMVTGWVWNNGRWYYMNESGAMVTGWILDNDKWYYMNERGAMVTGWVWNNGRWYYMNESGAMVTGWVLNNGKWYYMNENGAMTFNEWVDNGRYYVEEDGKWVPDKKK